MPYYEDEVCDEAVDAYYAWHKAQGTPEASVNAPNRYDVTRDDRSVYIRSGAGELGRYSIAEQRMLEPEEWETEEEPHA